MTRAEFKEWLKAEVTLSGALAIDLPDAEYDRIIDREIKNVYELSYDAVQEAFCIIPVEVFYTKQFRANRTIQFPACVLGVNKFVEMHRRNAIFGFNDPDFSFNRMFTADMWTGAQTNLENIMYRTVQMSSFDMLKRFQLVDIQHRWNLPSHQLLVLGHDPEVSVYCGLNVKVEESLLFDDIWVQRWIAAHAKLAASQLLGLFTTNIIGGVSINANILSESANKAIEECTAHWKDTNTVAWFRTIP